LRLALCLRSVSLHDALPILVSIVALAALIPLTAGYIDLSAGAITGMASITSAATMSRFHGPVVLAILLGVAVGILLGAVNGILIDRKSTRLNSSHQIISYAV